MRRVGGTWAELRVVQKSSKEVGRGEVRREEMEKESNREVVSRLEKS